MFKALLVVVSMWMVVGCDNANAAGLPAVNTNIVNANKAAFVGSMITSQTHNSGTVVIRQAVTPINREFKDFAACEAWVANLATPDSFLVARFIGEGNGQGKNLATDWEKYGYVGYIGGCVDVTDGSVTTPL